MVELWLRRITVSILMGIGVGLAAAGIDPPKGVSAVHSGYTFSPYLSGGGAGLITLGVLVGRRRNKAVKKPTKEEEQ